MTSKFITKFDKSKIVLNASVLFVQVFSHFVVDIGIDNISLYIVQ